MTKKNNKADNKNENLSNDKMGSDNFSNNKAKYVIYSFVITSVLVVVVLIYLAISTTYQKSSNNPDFAIDIISGKYLLNETQKVELKKLTSSLIIMRDKYRDDQNKLLKEIAELIKKNNFEKQAFKSKVIVTVEDYEQNLDEVLDNFHDFISKLDEKQRMDILKAIDDFSKQGDD